MQRKNLLAMTAAGGLLLALAGCTGEPAPDPSASASETAAAEAPETYYDVTDQPSNEEGMSGALSDTETPTCEPTDDGWAVGGTATNSTEEPVNYRIFMSLLDEGGATVAVQQINVDGVEPGATAEWDAVIPVEGDGLGCVPRVERRPA